MRKVYLHTLLIAAIILAAGCKRTKDTFTSRLYHNTVSKFNPLFNGEQALLKAVNKLNDLHKDNFDEILPVYKLGDEQLVSTVKPELEKAIEKGAKVIQEHSMLIRNDEKNKFIDDSYLLVGKARFYQRDYSRSLETFNFILLEYPKSKSIYDARLWAARGKTKIGNYLAAKSDFEELYREEEMPRDLKADVYASYAQMEIEQGNYQGAYQLLRQAIDRTKEKQKEIRWLFITGQLQSRLGNDYEASEIFLRVIRKGPPYELLFQAQLNRARNYDVKIQDPAKAFGELNVMLKDDKNYENRDQIYYVMAELAEKLEDEAAMEDYLKKSIRVSTNNQKQKALSYLKLAETNFRNKLYTTAEAYYDSTFNNLDPEDPRYKSIEKKKASLNSLVQNLTIIEVQDSLQQLAGLSEEQRIEVIDKHIQKLKDEEERKRLQDQSPLNNFALNSQGGDSEQSSEKGGVWYFYNQNLRSVGLTDFTNRFGNRKLEDNWRRKNKQTIASFNGQENNNDGGEEASISDGAAKPEETQYSREEFLTGIPLTQESLAASHEKIIDAFMNVGRIYKDELSDLDAASKALEDLLKRYPEMEERGRVWYTLYRIYTTAGDSGKAGIYSDLILQNMPDSEYALLIKNADSDQPLADKDVVKAFYTGAYKKYVAEEYKSSLSLSQEGISKYGESAYAPKFYLLKAFSQVKMGKKDEFISSLKLVVDRYSATEEAEEARNILAQLDEGGDEVEASTGEATKPNPYKRPNQNAQHKYVIVLRNEGAVVNQLRIDITDFNKKFFAIDNLNTKSVLLDSDYQIILVSNFNNSKRAMDFYNTLLNQNALESVPSANKVRHFVISSDNFQKFYALKDVEEYLSFFKENYLKKNG